MKQIRLISVIAIALYFVTFTMPAGAQHYDHTPTSTATTSGQGGNSQGGNQGGQGGNQNGQGYSTSATEMTGIGLVAASLIGAGIFYFVRRRNNPKTSA